MIQVYDRAILPGEVLSSLKTDTSGSVVMHLGIVRPASEGKRLVSIEYQAEKSKAEQELSTIAGEIANKWEIQDVALCRRTGKLDLGDIILVAAVAAPHRKEAFEACRYAVERMRTMNSMKKGEIVE